VWAWKKGRVKKMKGVIDKMLVVFPFEVPIYQHEKIPVEFVGHPLVEEMQEVMEREEFYKKFSLDKQYKFIAVIPGSRKQEIHNLFQPMLNAAIELAGTEMHVVVAVASNLSIDEYLKYVPYGANIKFIQHFTHEVMKHAEFAFVTSGTATLETACSGTPMVVVYKTSPLTYWIAKRVVKIKNIALANIVAGKTIVPELIQGDVKVKKLLKAARNILHDRQNVTKMKEELKKVREKLGGAGASQKVAQAILAV
jgi:lipid-A-disaccharide synthase